MKSKKNIFKLFTLIVILLSFNCSKEVVDNTSLEESNLEQSGLTTVPIENSLEFFKSVNLNEQSKKQKGINSIDVNIEIETLEQITLTNTDAKLNIAKATTKYKDVETQVLQIVIDGRLQTVLLHHIPEKSIKMDKLYSSKTDSPFSGSIYSTDFSGTILSGFKISNGNILGSFNFFTNSFSTNPCYGITCGIELDEVIVSPPPASTYNYVSASSQTTPFYYQWNRSQNNYSSMGMAYANYYRSIELQKWNNITIDESGPKIDPKEATKCFDKTKGSKLTIYIQQPTENSLELIGENNVGHVFVGIEQDGIRRVFGFYPPPTATNAGIAVGNDYVSELRDNSGELYHVSISTNINATQMSNIIQYVQNHPKTYNLNNYACTDFGIAVGNLGGLNLPSTKVSGGFGLFNGRSPAKLGQEVRAANTSSNRVINKSKGNAPSKTNEKC